MERPNVASGVSRAEIRSNGEAVANRHQLKVQGIAGSLRLSAKPLSGQ